jgi:signal transduction histidine kinase
MRALLHRLRASFCSFLFFSITLRTLLWLLRFLPPHPGIGFEQFGRAFYPLLLLTISAAPILINVLIVPRFPTGPLGNAEGMALRQLPVLFIALALIARQYKLPHVLFFSIATTALELGLISAISIDRTPIVLIFIATIRTISFIAIGIFISLLVTRLREQQEALQQANANLTHYASTLEQLTVSRERNRLARELHDTLAHSLPPSRSLRNSQSLL